MTTPAERFTETIARSETTTSVVEAEYAEAVEQFARVMANTRPDEQTLHALYRLNAAFYVSGYLPPVEHRRAVEAARGNLTPYPSPSIAMERGDLGLLGSGWSAARAAGWGTGRGVRARLSSALRRHAGGQERRGRLLAALEPRAGDAHAVLAVQHVLEVVPLLSAASRLELLDSTARYLAAIEPSPRLRDLLAGAERDQLRCWAVRNGRPPREGETLGWARCITRREPLQMLGQALASGLAFDAPLDALTVAAALRVVERPGQGTLHGLVAAHAVRRLSDLGGAPAIGPWLGMAAALSDGGGVSDSLLSRPTRDPRELALAAIRSQSAHRIQVAEAGLMEAEALPPDLRERVLQAVGALVGGSGQ